MKKKITILGGAGFIGHNLSIYLKKKGFECQVIDSLQVNNFKSKKHRNTTNEDLYKKILQERFDLFKKNKIKLFQADLRNLKSFSKLVEKFNPDYLIHLAAVSHANISNKDPEYTFDHSFRTLINALEVTRKIKCQLIYFSSSMVYGNFNGKRVTEKNKCIPIGIYGNLKLASEMMVRSYSHIFKFAYTIIRPSALYGERCVSRRVGQIFIENALQKKDILINGDGEEKLDFTYIEDLIQGVEKVINNKKSINETFNLTFGDGRAIKDLIKIIKKNFPDIKVQFKERDKFTPKRGGLNINKAKKFLGYKPKYKISNGYQKYIDWYKKMFKKQKIKF